MNHIPMTKQRRRILRALLAADKPLSAVMISEQTQVTTESVSLALARMADHGWLDVKGPPFRRQNVTRYFTLVPHVRTYIETVILGETDEEDAP